MGALADGGTLVSLRSLREPGHRPRLATEPRHFRPAGKGRCGHRRVVRFGDQLECLTPQGTRGREVADAHVQPRREL